MLDTAAALVMPEPQHTLCTVYPIWPTCVCSTARVYTTLFYVYAVIPVNSPFPLLTAVQLHSPLQLQVQSMVYGTLNP